MSTDIEAAMQRAGFAETTVLVRCLDAAAVYHKYPMEPAA